MRTRVSVYMATVVLSTLLVATVGCSKAPTDAQVSSDIQSKLSADSGLQGKQLGVQAEKGTVTLSGVVDNAAQRDAAAKYASSVAGVKQVVNNIQIENANAPAPDEAMQGPSMQAEAPPTKVAKPSPNVRRRANKMDDTDASADNNPPPAPTPEASDSNSSTPSQNSAPAPAASTTAMTATPPPEPQQVTLATGTPVSIRLVDEINTATAQQGAIFHATLNSALSVNGEVAIPAGYDVEGHIVAVQSAGKFAGQSILTLQLDRLLVGSKHYNVQSDQYHRETANRNKNTAEKVGGGAVVGAILGGIFGGGKGAAIGAGAGGAAGGGVQAASKSPQIDLPSETLLHFTLQAPVTVTVTTKKPGSNRPHLDTNNQ
ncbi:MAG TPA: BON domain-containing protein [Terriglobales bacterium]|nr:BON domain-containing protein [Terriglobales bacterium]